MSLPAGELTIMQDEAEKWLPDRATWKVHALPADDGAGGRTETWTNTNDPRGGGSTIPIRIQKAQPAESHDIGGEMSAAGRGRPTYIALVPARIVPKNRDQFVVASDGHTYEVVVMMDTPSFPLTTKVGVIRV